MAAPNPATFRQALSRFTTGVTVLTAAEQGGGVAGMTANSFTSVSLDPPTILVSVMQGRTLRAIERAGCFTVSVLGEGSEHVSAHFAGKPSPGWGPEYFGADGFVGLSDALARFECSVVQSVAVHDHKLLIAEVLSCKVTEAEPLVFFGSRYRRLAVA